MKNNNNLSNNHQYPILLVEDNQDDVILMERALTKAGMDKPVYVARDGVKAIEFLSDISKNYNSDSDYLTMIILLDLKLPKKSGMDVLKYIRNHPKIRNLPVIIFTSSNQASDIKEAYDNQANSYIVKPIAFGDLLAIAEMLKKYWFEMCSLPVIRMNTL